MPSKLGAPLLPALFSLQERSRGEALVKIRGEFGVATCSSRFRDHFIAADDSGAVGLPLASGAGYESRFAYCFARE
jgi:hypothetical protein